MIFLAELLKKDPVKNPGNRLLDKNPENESLLQRKKLEKKAVPVIDNAHRHVTLFPGKKALEIKIVRRHVILFPGKKALEIKIEAFLGEKGALDPRVLVPINGRNWKNLIIHYSIISN